MEKRQSLQQVVLGELESHMKVKEVRTFPYTMFKIYEVFQTILSRDIIKLHEENIGKTFSDIKCSNVAIFS